ncbi:hypothetical protein HYH02_008063 [Chlamydomonas schloesseri]|uniref:histone deacetylase n=1 Tax=Chlamydomonas schloesseri TaxID=2026947 RepID=A0A835WG70_9CHLO|nr:hypothetical protein HYH02_008063 [Chlamydomonas schloesseri]|eukprot:KAG2446907.1 hypothetical protein HYH02_008063 [Chlamydomonas schloesseri]
MACLAKCFQGDALASSGELPKDARVGLVFEDSMLKHAGSPTHPECPERAVELMAALARHGLGGRCVPLQPRQATDEELLRCHEPEHLKKVAAVSEELAAAVAAGAGRSYTTENFDSVYFSVGTARAARFAAGCVTQAVRSVVSGAVDRALAVVRPPGHHAVCERAMGFCVYNNVAVAVRDALAAGVKKVAIVDWDVHHGNGIQDLLYDEPRALFISLHRYGRGFYPGTGGLRELGRGPGTGFNVNVPWTSDSKTDADYQAAFHMVVEPLLRDFGPELLVVAAGFDASADDLIGDCDLLPEGYAWMTERLLQFAGGKVVLALEGGYNTSMTAECASACVRTLLDGRAAAVPPLSLQPSEETAEDLRRVYMFQRRFWRLRCPAGTDWRQDVLQSEKEWGEALAAEWEAEWRAFMAARRAAERKANGGSKVEEEQPAPPAATAAGPKGPQLQEGDSPAAALERVAAAAASRAATSAAAAASAATGPSSVKASSGGVAAANNDLAAEAVDVLISKFGDLSTNAAAAEAVAGGAAAGAVAGGAAAGAVAGGAAAGAVAGEAEAADLLALADELQLQQEGGAK